MYQSRSDSIILSPSRYVQISYENLEIFRQVKKIKSIKRDLNPLHSIHTQEPQPLHYRCHSVPAANHYFPPFIYRQTLETNPDT